MFIILIFERGGKEKEKKRNMSSDARINNIVRRKKNKKQKRYVSRSVWNLKRLNQDYIVVFYVLVCIHMYKRTISSPQFHSITIHHWRHDVFAFGFSNHYSV